jgi:ferritin-like protein
MSSPVSRHAAARLDRMFTPIHRWIWRDHDRRVQKLLRFGETETDGGRDLLRAAELTSDPLLRRLYLVHATDEQRHGMLFRRRAAAMLNARPQREMTSIADLSAPSGHGLDDLAVDQETDGTMLAFLHVAERSAASRFSVYRDVLHSDPATQRVFDDILRDEMFHMNYTLTQLVRVAPERHRIRIWKARLTRLWKAYLRLASALSGVIGGVMLTVYYFVVLPPFAWLAKRAARNEAGGWKPVAPERNNSLRRQY